MYQVWRMEGGKGELIGECGSWLEAVEIYEIDKRNNHGTGYEIKEGKGDVTEKPDFAVC